MAEKPQTLSEISPEDFQAIMQAVDTQILLLSTGEIPVGPIYWDRFAKKHPQYSENLLKLGKTFGYAKQALYDVSYYPATHPQIFDQVAIKLEETVLGKISCQLLATVLIARMFAKRTRVPLHKNDWNLPEYQSELEALLVKLGIEKKVVPHNIPFQDIVRDMLSGKLGLRN